MRIRTEIPSSHVPFGPGADVPVVDWTHVDGDLRWAMEVLGYGPSDQPDRDDVQRRFRRLLRLAHPDHGGEADVAADRIDELGEARRTLLAGLDPTDRAAG